MSDFLCGLEHTCTVLVLEFVSKVCRFNVFFEILLGVAAWCMLFVSTLC